MFERLKTLFTQTVIYGLGDVATSLVSFLLLPVFTRYLSPTEYGVIALLLTVEAVSKIAFRFGLDAAFMRLAYERDDPEHLGQLASTIFVALLAITGSLLAIGLAAAPWIAGSLFGTEAYAGILRLVLLNTFVIGFYFLPFRLLRIQGRSREFAVLTFSRSSATLVLRLLLVAGLNLGVLGVVLADLMVTAVFTIRLGWLVFPLLRPTFSMDLLRSSFRVGLPKLPGGVAQQVMAVSDRYFLSAFGTLQMLGVYSIGATIAIALKLFLSAFQTAWPSFVFETMRAPNARETFRTVTTWVFGIVVFLAATLSAVAADLVQLMAAPAFHGASVVVPLIAIGIVFQGLYQLTSIGIGISKRTEYTTVATVFAAIANVVGNVLLIPRFGLVGAGVAYAGAYAVLAASALRFSHRYYPIRHDWRRMAHVAAVALVSYAATRVLNRLQLHPAAGLPLRGTLMLVLFPGLLFITGFFQPRELNRLREEARRFAAARRWKAAPPVAVSVEAEPSRSETQIP